MTRWSLVRKNFSRKRLRTLFTVASISATLFGLTLLLGIVATIESNGTSAAVPRVIVHSASSLAVMLQYSQMEKMLQVPGVVAATPYSWFGGIWKDPKYFFAQFATEPRNFASVFPDFTMPEDHMQAWVGDRAGCAIGVQLAKQYGFKVGDKIFLQGTIWPIKLELTVRGIITPKNPQDNTQILLYQRDYFEELTGRTGITGSFWLRLRSKDDVPSVMKAVDQMFYNSDHETKTETERAFQLQFVSMLGNIRLMALFVGALAVVSILLIVGNTMAMSVRERTGEIAVLKTLGFTSGEILGMTLSESLGLSLLGGVLGVGGAGMLTGAIRAAAAYAPFLQGYHLAPGVVAIGAAVTLSVGLLSGAIPALNSSRIRVVEGLRKVV